MEASPSRKPARSLDPDGLDRRPATIAQPEGPREITDAPWPAELGFRTRLLVAAAAATDVPVRTALASIMFGASLQWGASPRAWRERSRLRFYAEQAQTHDPEVVFPKPPDGVAVKLSRPGRLAFRATGGSVSLLAFDSPYVAANPALRKDYAHHTRNAKAWAQHWRHDDGPRPTLCVIHGFGASPYVLNSAFFAVPWLFSKGYDVLLYLLPFHGPRRDLLSVVNGSGLFAHGPSHFNEAMLQSIHDFRIFLDHLEAAGVRQFGVSGLSLGGYVSALLAAVEPRLQVAIPNAPVTSMPHLISGYFPANVGVMISSLLHRIPIRETEDAIAVHSPLNYRPLLGKDRLMIIGGLGDRMAPPEQTRLLWEHWHEPRLHWYPGNHLLHVNRAAYLREMRKFMHDVGFGT